MLRAMMVVFLVMALALVWAVNLPQEAGAAQTQVFAAPLPRQVVAPGRIESRGEIVTLSAEMAGRLKIVSVKEGDYVQAGQVIARLDDTEYRARISQAEAQVTAAQATLLRLKNGPRVEEIRQAEAAILEQEAVCEHTALEMKRRQQLVKDNVVSRDQLDLCSRDERTARARLAYLKEARNLIVAGARKEDIAQVEAQITQHRAQVEEAKAILEKTLIRAPIAGRVLHRFRQTGESVEIMPASPILEIADTSVLRVRAEIDESDILRIRRGQTALITADALGGEKLTARVVSIGSILGRKSIRTDLPTEKADTRILEVLLDLKEDKLPLNLRVQVHFQDSHKQQKY
jgi:HlyD family secretion protein